MNTELRQALTGYCDLVETASGQWYAMTWADDAGKGNRSGKQSPFYPDAGAAEKWAQQHGFATAGKWHQPRD